MQMIKTLMFGAVLGLTSMVVSAHEHKKDMAAGTVVEVAAANNDFSTLVAAVKAAGHHGVKVNDANVTATDIKASNGVIHVIDSVLIP